MRRHYEFALAVVLVAILAIVLMGALDRARGGMEEAGVQAEAAAIRNELLEVMAHHATWGGELPAGDNPLDWVPTRPRNYLGAVDRPPAARGVWYFDRRAKELAYRFQDGHRARFRLSRHAGGAGERGVIGGVGLLRLEDQR